MDMDNFIAMQYYMHAKFYILRFLLIITSEMLNSKFAIKNSNIEVSFGT